MVNLYSIPYLVCGLLSLSIGILVLKENKRVNINRSFFYLTLSVFTWQVLTFALLRKKGDIIHIFT